MSLAPARPALSICVPTHDGRARTLAQGLEALLAKLTPELASRIEVCVSDNASRDGTEELVRELAAGSPVPIRYHRNMVDLGAGRNILRSVDMACGEYCWLMSSDDVVVEGALVRVLELLADHPGVGGMSVSCETFDRDFRHSKGPPPAGYLPPATAPRVIAGADRIVAELAVWFVGMSLHVVERRAWDAALRLHGVSTQVDGLLPHVAPLAVAGAISGRWLWCPERLVRWRESGTAPAGAGGLERYAADMFEDLARALAIVSGTRDPAYRQAVAKFARWHLGAPALNALASHPDHDWRTRLHLGRVMLRRLYWWPPFWRSLLPRLLVPPAARRALRAARSRLRAARAMVRATQ